MMPEPAIGILYAAISPMSLNPACVARAITIALPTTASTLSCFSASSDAEPDTSVMSRSGVQPNWRARLSALKCVTDPTPEKPRRLPFRSCTLAMPALAMTWSIAIASCVSTITRSGRPLLTTLWIIGEPPPTSMGAAAAGVSFT